MTNPPFSSAALRGAVDLSAARRPSMTGGAPAAPGAMGGPSTDVTQGYVVDATDASFEQLVSASVRYPVILLLWSPRQPESADFADRFAAIVRSYEGRMQLARVNVDENPALVQAFVQGQLPMCVAFLQGRPLPLVGEPQPDEALRQLCDQIAQVAVQSGVTGRVPAGDLSSAPADRQAEEGEDEQELSGPLAAAYEAIEAGDYDVAASAYREALAANPVDEEARLGLAQVELFKRTEGIDPQAARAAAADDPADVAAQTLVADLDVLGGHVDDAFTRLVDTVRVTADADRTQAREHLLGLFDVVGTSDARVIKARKALTAALF